MTAGNRQGFIIINLHACIRIYDVTLPPRSSSPVSSSSASTRGGNARDFFPDSRLSLSPSHRGTGDTRTAGKV